MDLIRKYIDRYPAFINGYDDIGSRIVIYTTRSEIINISKKDDKYKIFITTVTPEDSITDSFLLTPIDAVYLLQSYLTNFNA
jgi:hypothetical protein